jgi:phosphate:Na+ symporter
MSFLNFITMIGGIALFLYGMQVLGNGLQSVSGGRLEKILEKLTSNKWKGMLLGAGVTAVIQSSGATVVMVVGLVNSGIMDLNQAVGVILGANIGTTITAWILSMTGISSTNILLSMLKPANFSPVIALIGVFLLMFSKKDSRKYVGTIMVGFAVLMIGMTMMSDAFHRWPMIRSLLVF